MLVPSTLPNKRCLRYATHGLHEYRGKFFSGDERTAGSGRQGGRGDHLAALCDCTMALTLTLKNDLSEVVRSAMAIEAHDEARGWPPKWVTSVNLALDELLSNVIDYGYRDGDEHEVLVTLSERDGALEVVLEDEGVAFDPSTDRPRAGLGIESGGTRDQGVGRSFREIVHGRGRLRATRWPQSHHAAPAGSEDICAPPRRPSRCQCIEHIPAHAALRVLDPPPAIPRHGHRHGPGCSLPPATPPMPDGPVTPVRAVVSAVALEVLGREARCAGRAGGGSARSHRTARFPPARRAPTCRGSPAPLRSGGWSLLGRGCRAHRPGPDRREQPSSLVLQPLPFCRLGS